MPRRLKLLGDCVLCLALAGCAAARPCVVTDPPVPHTNPKRERGQTLQNAPDAQSLGASGLADASGWLGPIDSWQLRDDADSLRFLPHRVADDHYNFYSSESLTKLTIGLGIGAVLANTPIDEAIQQRVPSSAALH